MSLNVIINLFLLQGTKEIDAIFVDNMPEYIGVDMAKALKSMKKLRLLQFRIHEKLRLLPGSLRWLTWENYPLTSLAKSFVGNQLVGLELRGSSISEPWHGIKVQYFLV